MSDLLESNKHCGACSQNVHNTSRKNLGEGCEMESSPSFIEKTGKIISNIDGSAPQLCIYHTCADGVRAAVDALNNYKHHSFPTIRIDYKDELINVIPFGTAHKPSKWVTRFVEVKEPYRVFYEAMDKKVYKLSDTISYLIRSSRYIEA